MQVHVTVLVALQPWLKKNVKKPVTGLSRWVAWCREQFETLTAKVPELPGDFRRADPVTCKCADCIELKRFLKDPQANIHRFRVVQGRRDHLEEQIRTHHCDLDCATERSSVAIDQLTAIQSCSGLRSNRLKSCDGSGKALPTLSPRCLSCYFVARVPGLFSLTPKDVPLVGQGFDSAGMMVQP